MKAVIQKVSGASVTIDGVETASIGLGYLILLGVAQGDTEEHMKKLVKKIVDLRIFADEAGKINLSIDDVNGQLLVVSQFTLLADCKKGRRPSFFKAGAPDEANAMYEKFIEECRKYVPVVQHGEFGAMMDIKLHNIGPFTLVLDSYELFS